MKGKYKDIINAITIAKNARSIFHNTLDKLEKANQILERAIQDDTESMKALEENIRIANNERVNNITTMQKIQDIIGGEV